MEITKEQTQRLVMTGMDFQELEIADVEKLVHIVTSGLYSDPLVAVIREVLSNAWDSHRDRRRTQGPPPKPIQVYIDHGTSQLVIADYGTGIEPEKVTSVALALAGSDKDQDNASIGGWGLGFKSPYALSEQWSFDNRWKGRTTTYACMLIDDQVTASAVGTVSSLDAPNGVTIRIPLDPAEFKRALMVARYYARFLLRTDISLSIEVNDAVVEPPKVGSTTAVAVDGFEIRVHHLTESGSEKTPHSTSWETNNYGTHMPGKSKGAIITLGGVPYVIAEQDLKGLDSSLWKGSYWIEAPIGFLTPIPSRDSIRVNLKTQTRLKSLETTAMDALSSTFFDALMQTVKTPYALAELLKEMEADKTVKEAVIGRVLREIGDLSNVGSVTKTMAVRPGLKASITKASYSANKYHIHGFHINGIKVSIQGTHMEVPLVEQFLGKIKTKRFTEGYQRWGTNPPPLTGVGSYATEAASKLEIREVWGPWRAGAAMRTRVLSPEYFVLDDMGKGALGRVSYWDQEFEGGDKECLFITSEGPGTALSDATLKHVKAYLIGVVGIPEKRIVLASTIPDNVPAKVAKPTTKATTGASFSPASNPDDHEVKGTQVVRVDSVGNPHFWGPVNSDALDVSCSTIWAAGYRNDIRITAKEGTREVSVGVLNNCLNTLRSFLTKNVEEPKWRVPDSTLYDSTSAKPPALVVFQASSLVGDRERAEENWLSLEDLIEDSLVLMKQFKKKHLRKLKVFKSVKDATIAGVSRPMQTLSAPLEVAAGKVIKDKAMRRLADLAVDYVEGSKFHQQLFSASNAIVSMTRVDNGLTTDLLDEAVMKEVDNALKPAREHGMLMSYARYLPSEDLGVLLARHGFSL